MDNLVVKDIIKSPIAVATDSGDLVYNEIAEQLKQKKELSLDFDGISILTTAFLNAAIGQLYSNESFSSKFLNDHLKIINVQDDDKPLFSIVIQRAKEYFVNKKDFDDSANDIFYGK